MTKVSSGDGREHGLSACLLPSYLWGSRVRAQDHSCGKTQTVFEEKDRSPESKKETETGAVRFHNPLALTEE